MAEIDGIELEQFNNMVDNIIDDIEAGRTKANPLASEATTVADVDVSSVVVVETATEEGEESVSERVIESEADSTEVVEIMTINSRLFPLKSDGEIIGKAGKILIVVSSNIGEVVFGSAAVAGRETGISPTTVRDRCAKEKIDDDDNTWTYRDKTTEE